MLDNIPENAFLRLDQILKLIPVSKSAWWAGVKSGRFPKGYKLGAHTTAWKAADIYELMERFPRDDEKPECPL